MLHDRESTHGTIHLLQSVSTSPLEAEVAASEGPCLLLKQVDLDATPSVRNTTSSGPCSQLPLVCTNARPLITGTY